MYHLRPYSKTGNVVIESLSLLSLTGIFSLPDQRPKSTNKGRFVNINYFYHLGIFLWLNTIWLTNVSQIRKIRPRLSIYCLCHARNNFLWFFPKFFSNANCLCGVLKYLTCQGTPYWSDHVMATPFLFIILFTIHKYLWTRFEINYFLSHIEKSEHSGHTFKECHVFFIFFLRYSRLVHLGQVSRLMRFAEKKR